MIRKLALLAALFFSPLCIGGQSNGLGTIVYILAANNGAVFVQTTSGQIGGPPCAVAVGRFVVNGSTPAGKAMVAAIYTAYATNSRVNIVGTGTCDVWGDTETILFFSAQS